MKDSKEFYICNQQRLCCASSTCGIECIYTDDPRYAAIKDPVKRNFDIDEHDDVIYYWESISDLNNL